jgi:hypothetical protein
MQGERGSVNEVRVAVWAWGTMTEWGGAVARVAEKVYVTVEGFLPEANSWWQKEVVAEMICGKGGYCAVERTR